MGFFDLLLAGLILIFFILLFIVMPSIIAFFLIKRKWMRERTRIIFGLALAANIAIILILVIIRLFFR